MVAVVVVVVVAASVAASVVVVVAGVEVVTAWAVDVVPGVGEAVAVAEVVGQGYSNKYCSYPSQTNVAPLFFSWFIFFLC